MKAHDIHEPGGQKLRVPQIEVANKSIEVSARLEDDSANSEIWIQNAVTKSERNEAELSRRRGHLFLLQEKTEQGIYSVTRVQSERVAETRHLARGLLVF